MHSSKERRNALAPILLFLAGVAFLVAALLSLRESAPMAGVQLLPAALFFLASYLHHRRLR
jgi:hypothetical protein